MSTWFAAKCQVHLHGVKLGFHVLCSCIPPILMLSGLHVVLSGRHAPHWRCCTGYAGDVWNPQPPAEDHPWRTMPNHGMTPHYSGTPLDAQVLVQLFWSTASAPVGFHIVQCTNCLPDLQAGFRRPLDECHDCKIAGIGKCQQLHTFMTNVGHVTG